MIDMSLGCAKSVAANLQTQSSFLRNEYSIGLNVLHKCTGSKKRLAVNNNSISSKNYDDTKSVPQGVSEGVKIDFFKWKSIF